jgi:RNA-splicing ligase RtcB
MRNVEAKSTAHGAERISSRQRSSRLKGGKIEDEKLRR